MKKALIKLWVRFKSLFKRKSFKTLSNILSSADNREFFLGVIQRERLTPEQMSEMMSSDSARIIRYATSQDYSVWAKEVWSKTTELIDKLTDKDLTDAQVHYFRGALYQNLELLRLSYRALQFKEEASRNAKEDRAFSVRS